MLLRFLKGAPRLGHSPPPEPQVLQQHSFSDFSSLIHASTRDERRDLVQSMAHTGINRKSVSRLVEILQKTESLEELKQLVDSAGGKDLLRLRRKNLNELVAWAEIGTEFRNLPLLKAMKAISVFDSFTEQAAKLEGVFSAGLSILRQNENLQRTECFKRFHTVIMNAHDHLVRCANSRARPKQRMELLNRAIEMTEVGVKYGIALASAENEEGVYERSWSRDDIRNARAVFEKIPEMALLLAPKLCIIGRIPTLGFDTLGLREESGLILIADDAVDNEDEEIRSNGIPSLQTILCHEIGHAIQIGNASSKAICVNPVTGHISGFSDSKYKFEEFMDISGWCGIESSRYKFIYGDEAVILDGVFQPLDVPTWHEGELITLIYLPGEQMLVSHKTDSGFSLGTYGRTDPWEDWAEAFTDYILVPERLILFAPAKFLYFDKYFKKYESDEQLKKLVHTSLLAHSKRSGISLTQEPNLFAQNSSPYGYQGQSYN